MKSSFVITVDEITVDPGIANYDLTIESLYKFVKCRAAIHFSDDVLISELPLFILLVEFVDALLQSTFLGREANILLDSTPVGWIRWENGQFFISYYKGRSREVMAAESTTIISQVVTLATTVREVITSLPKFHELKYTLNSDRSLEASILRALV